MTKLEKAGFKLSTAAPLLKKADELDALGILEASNEKVLPLVATAIDSAPSLIPLAALALKQSPSVLTAGAIASFSAAAALVTFVPDDSVSNIALQTFFGILLGAILPGGLFIGSFVLGKLGNK